MGPISPNCISLTHNRKLDQPLGHMRRVCTNWTQTRLLNDKGHFQSKRQQFFALIRSPDCKVLQQLLCPDYLKLLVHSLCKSCYQPALKKCTNFSVQILFWNLSTLMPHTQTSLFFWVSPIRLKMKVTVLLGLQHLLWSDSPCVWPSHVVV